MTDRDSILGILLNAVVEAGRSIPQEVGMDWPSILNASPVLRKAAMSKEGLAMLGAVRDMRKKLAMVMVEEGLISEGEAGSIGIVPLLGRLTEHLKQVERLKREDLKRRIHG